MYVAVSDVPEGHGSDLRNQRFDGGGALARETPDRVDGMEMSCLIDAPSSFCASDMLSRNRQRRRADSRWTPVLHP